MRRIAVINQKGGVGKTTSCCNIGATIAAAGHRVLLLDLDPQAHLTMHLGVEPDGDKPSVYNVLTDNLPLADACVEVRENLTLVPSHIDLAAAEMELVSVMGREVILRDALQKYDRPYDFMMIDCPPSLGVLTINGLAAVGEIIVPMQPHFLALQGVGKLLETIGLVKSRINPEVRVSGIILCMYEAGTRLAGEVSADLSSFLEQSRDTDAPWSNAVVYRTIIRRNIKLAECPSHGQTIAEYAPQSNGAADYAALTAEILGVETLNLPSSAAASAAAPKNRAKPVETARATPVAVASDVNAAAEVVADTDVPDEAEAVADVIAEREPAPVNLRVEGIAVREEPLPAVELADRTVHGPDIVAPTPADPIAVEPTPVTPDEPVVDEQAAPEQPAEPSRPTPQRIPPRRSIPVFYEDDDADVPAGSGTRRD